MYEELKKVIEQNDNIVFFGGAGVSTESGIPVFRSVDGVYHQKYKYPPETILSQSFFMTKTADFYDFYREKMICTDARPNKAHIALAKLEQQGKLRAVVTQNIDGLHQKAGSRKVYELHGSVLRNYCMKCRRFYDISAVTGTDGVPKCTCGGIIKPDVVLYEEGLDDKTVDGAVRAIAKADVLIIGGTSLNVYPAAGFLNYFGGHTIVLLNKSETIYDSKADIVIRDPIGQVLGEVVS